MSEAVMIQTFYNVVLILLIAFGTNAKLNAIDRKLNHISGDMKILADNFKKE